MLTVVGVGVGATVDDGDGTGVGTGTGGGIVGVTVWLLRADFFSQLDQATFHSPPAPLPGSARLPKVLE